MDYRIAHSIHEFDEACWDAVAGSEPAMTHRWQRMIEASWSHYRPRYLLLQDRQGPLAIVIADATQSFGCTGWRKWLFERSILALQAPFSATDCGVMTRPGAAPATGLPQLEPALRELGWQVHRPLLGIANIATPDLPLWQARHFFASAQLPNTVLDLPPTYERYLEMLPTQDRTKIRRTRRRAERFDVSFEHSASAGESEQLHSMIGQVSARHQVPESVMLYTRALLAALEREMADELIVFRGFVEGTFAGHLLCLTSGQRLWWLATGLHYELAHPSYLYFLLMDEMVRWSIEHGIRRIYGGLTSEREKQKHGFRLYERWFCYRASSPSLNNGLALVLPFVRRLMGHV